MRKYSSSGFSILEVIFVAEILGFLTIIAMPRFKTYQALNKRKEATSNLNQIYMLLQTKFNEDKSYSLGITTAQARYLYGRVMAVGNVPDGQCNDADNWPKIIGFKITPCDTSDASKKLAMLPTYAYNLILTPTTFTAQACDLTRVVNNCSSNIIDKVTINQNQVINVECDAIGICGETCTTNTSTACIGSSTN